MFHIIWAILFIIKLYKSVANIGAGSRGAGGSSCPLEIFWFLLGNFFPSWDLYLKPFLGQKNAPNPAKYFFWRTLVFGTRKRSKSGEDLFFLFWRTLVFRTRKRSNSSDNLFSRSQILALLVLSPCPKIVLAPLVANTPKLRVYMSLHVCEFIIYEGRLANKRDPGSILK